MIDEQKIADEQDDNEPDLAVPDFLDRANPEVVAIVNAGRELTLEARKTELAKATAPKTVTYGPPATPKPGSATAMAARPKGEAPAPKPAKVAKPAKVVNGKKSDAEMIALINEHRAAAGNTAGKTLKVLRGLGISCSQERFKGLYVKAS